MKRIKPPKDHRFKPRRLTKAEKKKLRQLGFNNIEPYTKPVPFIEKNVTDTDCQLCDQVLDPDIDIAVCPRCQNCLYCGSYNDRPESNYCFACGNQGDDLESDIPTTTVIL